MSEDQEEKTEEPTQRRLEDARKRGQVASSREVSNFFIILTLTLLVALIFPYLIKHASDTIVKYFIQAHQYKFEKENIKELGTNIVVDIISILGVPFIFLIIAAIGAAFIQNGFFISVESIMPKFEKISIVKGFGRIFSMRSFMEFIKGLIKITIVGIIAYVAVIGDLEQIGQISKFSTMVMLELISTLSMKILIAVTIAVFIIAVLDFMYQKHEFMKQMRMTKQELKEEYKQQEGDPKIKGKLRQIRMERSRRRMMAAVPTADVVITNPTHYAIALKYDQAKMAAPVVVAKGNDKVAERIKAMAEDNKIPIVRNAPLARALHDECDLDEQVPLQHFKAVAEVISYVYKLKGRR